MKEILKNNILSVICGVVVIIALVVPIWPMGGYKQELETRLTQRAGTYNTLNSLRTKQRNLPVVDLENPNPTPLDGFPNENVIAKASEVKNAFETQSTQLVNEAVKLNRHAPLVKGSLPTASSTAILLDFRDRYRNAIATGFAQQWHVGTPPALLDIQNAQADLWRTKYQPQLGSSLPGATGLDRQRQMLQDEFTQESTRLPDQLRYKVAMNSWLYMNADALPYILSFNNKEVPQPTDIWNAQLNLWIIDDIGHGILDANAGATNVPDAPIKHLIKIGIPYPQPYIVSAGQTLDGDLTGPAPKVTDLSGGTAGGSLSGTPMTTGRVSNPLYDVVQFDLILNVDAAQVPRILAALSHNRFVTVLTSSVTAVDSAAMQQQGYIYGKKPVVQLTLKCEDIFFHKWERELMPDVVAKAMTGVLPNQGAGDTAY